MRKEDKKIKFPTAYSILLAITGIIAIITQFVPEVTPAKLSDFIMAPMNGLNNAIDISIFVLIIGGFLGVVTKTGALDAGIGFIVNKLKGRELYLIPVLMFIFSIGGSTYGMAEETVAFYALITATMIAAGFDSLVAVGTVLLGAGCGVLGSTVNPFAIGASISASSEVGVKMNQGIIIAIGIGLWISSLLVCIYFVMNYAKKVKLDKNKSILSEDEIDKANEVFSNNNDKIETLTGKRKIVLFLFAISFVIMIMGVIPWEEFGVTIFSNTLFLTGVPLGQWWFLEIATIFLIMAIVIGVVYGLKEREIVSAFLNGAADMVGVALVIGISRGISVIMGSTGLDMYILDRASNMLNGVSGILFINMAYIVFIGLSFLIPSTSGLASVSMPILAPLTQRLGLSPELMVSAFSAGSGIVNLITPTSGVVMGGLTIAKVEYSTWIKFMWKVLIGVFIVSIIVLSIGMLIL